MTDGQRPADTVTPPTLCPFCGYAFDRAGHMSKPVTPKPGDFTVCLSCAGVMQFGVDLRAVQPAPDALAVAFAEQPGFKQELRRLQAAILMLPERPNPQQRRGPVS